MVCGWLWMRGEREREGGAKEVTGIEEEGWLRGR